MTTQQASRVVHVIYVFIYLCDCSRLFGLYGYIVNKTCIKFHIYCQKKLFLWTENLALKFSQMTILLMQGAGSLCNLTSVY